MCSLSPRAILAGGWAVFELYAYPGYMSWDSMTQLAQARRGIYTDDHPPAMAALWRVLELVVTGPLPMLLLGSIPFVIGLYVLLSRVMASRAAAIATVLLLWFPPIGTVIAAIYKDTLMASLLVAGTALLVSERRRMHTWGLVLISAATAMRYNAIAATLPIVVLLYRFRGLVGWRRYAIAATAWLAVTAAAMGVNAVLADRAMHYWYRTHALMDIAGTLNYARDYSDDEVARLLDGVPLAHRDRVQERFREGYQPVDFRQLDRGPMQIFVAPQTETERIAVARAWRDVIHDNLGAYLHYRWDNFAMLLRLDHRVYDNAPITFVLRWHEEADFIGHDLEPGRIQRELLEVNRLISRTPLFDPYPYALLALALLAFALRDRLIAALLLSGLAYEGAWFLLAPTADYRYSHWMITCTLVAAVMLVAKRMSRSGS